MKRVIFPGEFAGQVWIALPIAFGITIGQAGVFAAGSSISASVAAMRQGIGIRMTNEIARFRAAGKVASLASGIAPGSLRIPVPGSTLQLCILAIANRSPGGGKRLLQNRGR